MRLFSQESLPERSSLNGEFQNFVTDVERVVKDLQQLTGEGLSRARSELESRVTRAKSSLSEASRTAVDRAGQAKEAVTEYVSEKPWHAVAIAIAVGAIVAVMLTRRSGTDE